MDAWHYNDAQLIARFEEHFHARVIRLHRRLSGLYMDADLMTADGRLVTRRLLF